MLSVFSTGTGFLINRDGHVITNYHVIDGADRVTAVINGGQCDLSVIATDQVNDLALLRMEEKPQEIALFRQDRHIKVGEVVVVIGFPHGGQISTEPTVTAGNVSSTTGPSNDSRMVQITASVHGGNSGGPLLDRGGNVIGIVNAKIDAIKFLIEKGDIPQNINFAISSNIVLGFLDAHNVKYEVTQSQEMLDVVEIAKEAKPFVAMLCALKESSSAYAKQDNFNNKNGCGALVFNIFLIGVFVLIMIVLASI